MKIDWGTADAAHRVAEKFLTDPDAAIHRDFNMLMKYAG
jgi:hypothetical protein